MTEIYKSKDINLFELPDITIFNITDLDGKALRMVTAENDRGILLAGQDIDTGVIYLIKREIKRVK